MEKWKLPAIVLQMETLNFTFAWQAVIVYFHDKNSRYKAPKPQTGQHQIRTTFNLQHIINSHKSNLDKSWDRKLECNVEHVVVVGQRVMLVIMNQFNHRWELQWLDESKLAILMKDLYQLITSTFPVNNNTGWVNNNSAFSIHHMDATLKIKWLSTNTDWLID